ncbi:MAG: YdeI/OmpD-associated family protein [Actinomycetota bacterium]|nr:YdeI/OmpD-associated family protein [Actinomycetota bacterium]
MHSIDVRSPGEDAQLNSPKVRLPPDLERALDFDPRYERGFEALSPNQKADSIRWIESSDDPERRKRRIDKALRSLH